MRVRAIGLAVLLSVAAITASAAVAAGANRGVTKKIKCHVESHIQSFPKGSSPGTDFSFVNCSAPFGRGLQYSTFRLTPKTATTGAAVLRFRVFFETGSVAGVWRATYQFTDPSTGVFTQRQVTWGNGTGAFKHVRASGTGHGVLHGTLGQIHQVLTVTGL